MPSYEAKREVFARWNVQVLGISIDHIPCLKAWADSLGGINYPLLSDFWPHGEVARKYHAFRDDGRSERAIFIIDKHGLIQYIDIHDIDDQPSNEVLIQELKRISPDTVNLDDLEMGSLEDIPGEGIVLYCTKWCPGCRKARLWLRDRNIAYTEVDIDSNPQAAARVREWTGGNQTTPTFDINGTIIVNYNENELEKLLIK